VRPNDPLRPKLLAEPMLTAPVVREVRTETRPKPLGFCLPTPGSPPTTRDENIVDRATGR